MCNHWEQVHLYFLIRTDETLSLFKPKNLSKTDSRGRSRRLPYYILTVLTYFFCLISIGLSSSDEGNKLKFLNIERA